MSIYSEIKKYLLYLVGFFCVLLCAHLVVLYLYSDAKTYALPGGTLNIGIVGNAPSMDILATDTKIESNSTDLVMKFLYRGLLAYSNQEKKITNDMANCNIDGFPVVRCTLLENLKWTDGTKITNEDVLNSYEFFEQNTKNEGAKSRLDLIDISEDDGDLLFRFKTRDITMIDVMFLPVLKKSDMQNMADHYDLAGHSFSGPYVFESYDRDKGTILLKKNTQYSGTTGTFYFDRIRFGFGDTVKSVNKVIKSDILVSDTKIDDDDGMIDSYIRPVFFGTFLNSRTLTTPLRVALIDVLDSIQVTDENYLPENNVFLGDVPTTPHTPQEGAFAKAVQTQGYGLGGTTQSTVDTTKIVTTKPLKYINNPGGVTPLFVSQAAFEIGGSVPAGTTSVTIDDYTLKNFEKKSAKFSYKVRAEFGNLKEGENNYNVSFFAGSKLLAQEGVKIFFNTNKQALDALRSDWEKSQLPPASEKPVAVQLNPNRYYKNTVPLAFTLIVQSDVPLLATMADELTKKINTLGAEVQVSYMSLADIKKNVNNPDVSYDLVLTGVNLGLFHYNILPFFHSGQVSDGLNFSRLKNASLDSLMERAIERFYFTTPDRLRDLQVKIQKILEEQAVVAPIASPYEYIWVKNSVNGLDAPEFLPGIETLSEILSDGYFKQGYKRSDEPKTVNGFFDWLIHALFPST